MSTSSAYARATQAPLETDRSLPLDRNTTVVTFSNFTKRMPMKRVSFYIPEALYNDIQEFAEERGDSMTGVLRWSLGVGKAIWDQVKNGYQIRSYPGPRCEATTERDLVFMR